MSILVKVIRIPGAVNEVGLSDEATVADALAAAGTTVASGESVKVNGNDCGMDTVLDDGDRVVIAKGAKGNV